MSKQLRVKGGQQARTFYDRKVLTGGNGRQISVGKLIPKHWKYVRLRIVDEDEEGVVLLIKRLNGGDIIPRNKGTGTRDKQDTQRTRTANSHEPSGSKS